MQRTVRQSMVILQNTLEKNLNGKKLQIVMQQNRLEFLYISQNYIAYSTIITKETYEKDIGKYFILFPQLKIFSKLIASQNSQMILRNESELIITVKHPLTSKSCEIQLKLQSKGEVGVEYYRNQISSLKSELINKNMELSSIEGRYRKMIQQMKQKHQNWSQKSIEYNCSLAMAQELSVAKENGFADIKLVESPKTEDLSFDYKEIVHQYQKEHNYRTNFCRSKKQVSLQNYRRGFKLQQQEINFNQISQLALPSVFRQQFNDFKRIYLNEPKYILSVFGACRSGKSTFLSQLMKSVDESITIKSAQEFKKSAKTELFPKVNNPITFYDTVYSFNVFSDHVEIAREVNSQNLIYVEKFQEDGQEMTLFIEDRLQFKQQKHINLIQIQLQGRANFAKIESLDKQLRKLQNKYLVLRHNRNIIDDRQGRYDCLNKYAVLMNRAGIDDDIFNIKTQQTMQVQRMQLKRLKNETVFYCVPCHRLIYATKYTKDHLLSLLQTHDFQKIVLCVNFIDRFNDGDMQKKRQLQKLKLFFFQMFEAIPDFMRNLLDDKINSLKYRLKKNNDAINKFSKDSNHLGQENSLYSQDRKLRLKLNRYRDVKKNYDKICEKLMRFSEQIKNQIENGLSKEISLKIKQIISRYPFQNIYIFGLQQYTKKFQLIQFLRTLSIQKLKKNIVNQSLCSLQKIYLSKIEKIRDFSLNLQKYYTIEHIFRQLLVQNLAKQQELKLIQKQKTDLLEVCYQIQLIFKSMIKRMRQQLDFIQENKNKKIKTLVIKEQKTWENHLEKLMTNLIQQCIENFISVLTKYKQNLSFNMLDYIYRVKKMLVIDYPKLQLEKQINIVIEVLLNEVNKLCKQTFQPFIDIWNEILASVSKYLTIFIKQGKNIVLKIPYDLSIMGKFFTCKFDQQLNLRRQNSENTNVKRRSEERKEEREEQEYIEKAERSINEFVQNSIMIGFQLAYKIDEVTEQILKRKMMLAVLLQKKGHEQIKGDQKIVEDYIIEMRKGYLQKIKRIEFDLIVSGVSSAEQFEIKQ